MQCRLAGAFATSVDFVHRQQEQYEQREQKQNARLLIDEEDRRDTKTLTLRNWQKPQADPQRRAAQCTPDHQAGHRHGLDPRRD